MTVSDRLRPFGTTIFSEMTALANQHKAVNLSQGFPDFDGPEHVKEAARQAIADGHNQYARMPGAVVLCEAIARYWKTQTGLSMDAQREVTVTNGCTEAINAAMLGLVNTGDEVVLFEPYYDCYRAAVAMAGAVPRFVALRPDANGRFVFDETELRAAFSDRTRAILVNTPHNPTGKVFTREELSLIGELCIRHNSIAMTDEVYERLTYDGAEHVRMATLPGMAERTLTLSSLGKSFSLTGWKIGWAIGPAELTAGVRAAHQFLTFAVALPLQHAAAVALDEGQEYIDWLLEHYRVQRARLGEALFTLGMMPLQSEGTYFLMADHTRVSEQLGVEGDVAFCRLLTTEYGVAAIPPSVFYDRPELGRSFVRFAYCKRSETMDEALLRLKRLGSVLV